MSPVRKVQNHNVSSTGKFPSTKMETSIDFESLLELDFIYLLEFDKYVTAYECQPLTIEYKQDGKLLHYTPDFSAVRKGENWLFECKPERFVNKPTNQRKYHAAQQWGRENGWHFQVMTDLTIRAGVLLRNVKYLTGFSDFIVSPVLKAQIYSALLETKTPISICDLAHQIENFSKNEVFPAIFKMAFYHEIELPVDQELISQDSIISIEKR